MHTCLSITGGIAKQIFTTPGEVFTLAEVEQVSEGLRTAAYKAEVTCWPFAGPDGPQASCAVRHPGGVLYWHTAPSGGTWHTVSQVRLPATLVLGKTKYL